MKRFRRILSVVLFLTLFFSDASSFIGMQQVEAATKAGLMISHKQVTVIKGQKQQLYVTGTTKTVKWSTSNKKVAKVSNKGVVTAKKKGTSVIKAKVGKKVLKCKVKVVSSGLNYATLSLGKGDSAKLKVLNNKKKVTWKSKNKKICTVTSGGKVKANKAGSTTIVAKVGKSTFKCAVTVKKNEVKKKDSAGSYEFEYNPEVKKDELKKEKAYTVVESDGEVSVSIKKDKNTKTVASGDVIVLPANSRNEMFAMKVQTVKTSGSKYIFTGEAAEYTDVFEDIDINSKKKINFNDFDIANTVTYYNSDNKYASRKESGVSYTSSNKDKISVETKNGNLKVEFQGSNGMDGTVTLAKPEVNTDIDISIKNNTPTIKKLNITLTEELKTSFGYKGKADKDLFIGHKTVPIKDGFVLDLLFYLKLKASGEASIVTKTKVTAGIDYYNGKNHSVSKNNSFTFEKVNFSASASAALNPQIALRWGGYWSETEKQEKFAVRILKVEGKIGPSAKVSTAVHTTKPYTCTDVHIWLAVSVGVNDSYGVGKLLAKSKKISLEWKILEDNSKNKFRYDWHLEDGKAVDNCTVGNDGIGADNNFGDGTANSGSEDSDLNNSGDADGNIHWEGDIYWKEENKQLYVWGNANGQWTWPPCIDKSVNKIVFNVQGLSGSLDNLFEPFMYVCEIDLSRTDTSHVSNMSCMFRGCEYLTSLDISGLDTSCVTDMSAMFRGCSSLTALDVSGFDTSKVTDMGVMFDGCSSLTALDVSGFDTSKVTDMSAMFYGCSSLTALDVSGFDTSKVTKMDNLFYGCSNLSTIDVSKFNTSNVDGMVGLFCNCSKLVSIDVSGFDTSKVILMTRMFSGCSSLVSIDVSGFDTSKTEHMSEMFESCTSLKKLDLSGFDTSNVRQMPSMFAGCNKLTSLNMSGFKTSKVENMNYMFSDCSSLITLDISGWNIPRERVNYMFYNCSESIIPEWYDVETQRRKIGY